METLQEEGLTLINKPELITYIAPNGASAIDLVLFKGNGIKAQDQNELWTSGVAPIRKHIPIKKHTRNQLPEKRGNK